MLAMELKIFLVNIILNLVTYLLSIVIVGKMTKFQGLT